MRFYGPRRIRVAIEQRRFQLRARRELEAERFVRDLLAREPHLSEPGRLAPFEQRVFSQNGEDGVIAELCQAEAHYGIEPGMKRPDWGLTPATLAWYGGMPMEELEEELDINPGDMCRVFRMAIQLLRQAVHDTIEHGR